MKYQPGDTILLLHSNEEGEVLEILSNKMVLIDVKGVKFPVYTDQIDFPYFMRFRQKQKSSAKKQKLYIDDIRREKVVEQHKEYTGMWLTFVPVFDKDVFDEDIVEKFKLYLRNETPYSMQFEYEVMVGGEPDFHLQNIVHPFNNFYLHDVAFEEMNDSPRFECWFQLVPPDKNKVTEHKTSTKIKAKQLFQRIEEMRMKNEPSFSILLFEEYPQFIPDDTPDYHRSPDLYDISETRQKLEPARSVVDLHIDKLTNDWKGLSNREILQIQLKEFEKYYHLALVHHQRQLIVIHGVGKGVLKEKIHEALKMKREVKSFVNQYHPSFGFGATEIYFK